MDLERTMFARRFVQVQERCKTEWEEGKEDPVRLPKRQKTTDGRRKRRCERDRTQRYQSVGKVKESGLQPISRWDTAKRNVHVIIGTHQHVHTTNAHGRDTGVFKRTGKAGEEQTDGQGTIATQSDESQEFYCVLNGGHTTSFSERSTKKQLRVRLLSQCGKDTSVLEREKDHRKDTSQRGPRNDRHPNALHSRLCINSGFCIVKNRHE